MLQGNIPSAHFVAKVELDAQSHFQWSATHINSKGWSGSVLLNPGARSVFLEQVRTPTEWSNEIHVLWPGNWRETQVAAYLDDGTVYAAYGKRVHAPRMPWRNPKSIAGVVVALNESVNTATVTFFCGHEQVTMLNVSGAAAHKHVSELRLEVRAHPHGAITLIDRPH